MAIAFLILLWAIVLVPPLVRRFSEMAPNDSVRAFRHQLGVLSRRVRLVAEPVDGFTSRDFGTEWENISQPRNLIAAEEDLWPGEDHFEEYEVLSVGIGERGPGANTLTTGQVGTPRSGESILETGLSFPERPGRVPPDISRQAGVRVGDASGPRLTRQQIRASRLHQTSRQRLLARRRRTVAASLGAAVVLLSIGAGIGATVPLAVVDLICAACLGAYLLALSRRRSVAPRQARRHQDLGEFASQPERRRLMAS